MLSGKVLLFDNVARNPLYLKQQLDYYGARGCGFKLDNVTVDPNNDRGRVLSPEYLNDLRNGYGGQVFGWSTRPIDVEAIRWLNIPGYLIWQDQMLTSEFYTPVVNLVTVDPDEPPNLSVKSGPIAFLRSDILFEMSHLNPGRVYKLAAWLRNL